jgi:predicted TIM-barrel fold metal-dependent hydrolase
MSLTLESLRGRVFDPDSHEQILPSGFAEAFGERGAALVASNPILFHPVAYNQGIPIDGDYRDTLDADDQSVWEVKGSAAPATIDFDRRLEVLDVMGIQRQLVFPGMGLVALVQAQGGFGLPSSDEQKRIAWEAVDAYNDWAGEQNRKYGERLSFVGMLKSSKPGATADSLLADAEQLLELGLPAVLTTTGKFLDGASPSDYSLDPFYTLLEEANVPLLTHPPGAMGFFSPEWERVGGARLATVAGLAEQNFITVLTLGGVFERHPGLRFGAIEMGSSWIGGLGDHMDFLATFPMRGELGVTELSMKPTEYLARNVRVAAHFFEPVETYIERYPHLQDVYCYSTDYPHKEGREHSLEVFFDQVSPLGDDIVEKFFYKNAELLFP